MDDKIYIHEEAANIIELFTSASLYGIVYSELLDEVEDKLLCIIERVKAGDKVVEYEFQ